MVIASDFFREIVSLKSSQCGKMKKLLSLTKKSSNQVLSLVKQLLSRGFFLKMHESKFL